MKKNTKVTAVANPFAQIFAAMDPAQASALLAILSKKGVTVKKEAAKKVIAKARKPEVVAYHACAAASRAAYKAAKAQAIAAGKPYYEIAKAAGDAAVELFYEHHHSA